MIKTFDDLGSVTWAKKPIEVLASAGILRGVSDAEFAPQAEISRADFLYYLVRTLGLRASFEENFKDVDSSAYYCKEIGIAKELGITDGTGDNNFSPNASITRQDMMVLAEKALRLSGKLEVQGTASDLDEFADKHLIASYAVDSIAALVKEELVKGSDNKINPLDITTRAEAAVLLYRIYTEY
ncbi:MAG: S-layer homology domain-containing protein [bacterium]